MKRKKYNVRHFLKGKKIVVTRAREQSSEFASRLKFYGAQVLCSPTIRIVPPKSFKLLDRAVKNITIYDWLIFTSVNGVEKFVGRYKKFFKKNQFPRKLKTCAIGPATALLMRKNSIPVSKISKEYVAESILKELKHVRGKKILIPRAEQAREILPETLTKRGAQVDVVPAYRTVLDSSNFHTFVRWLKSGEINCITFTSSSTVRNFFSMLKKKEKKELIQNKHIHAASIGPVTSRTLKDYGWYPSIKAEKPTTKHLCSAIANFYKNHRKSDRL